MRRNKKQGVTIAAFSDTHVGSTYGLMYPQEYQLADGNRRPSKLQRSLWERFEQYAATVAKKRRRHQLIVVVAGDMIDGDHHNTHQLHTRKLQEQEAMFADVLDFFLDEVKFKQGDQLYIINGTEVNGTHGNAASTDAIARDFRAVPRTPPTDPDKPRDGWYPWQFLELDIRGHLFQFTHHPAAGLGTRAHTKGNAIRSWLRSMQFERVARGLKVPRFTVWGHVHTAHTELARYDNGTPVPQVTEAVVLPALQLPTDYVDQIRPYRTPTTIGGWWATVSADGLDVQHGLEFVEFDPRPEPLKI